MTEKELYYGDSTFVYGIGCDVFDLRRLEGMSEEKLSLMGKRIFHDEEIREFELAGDKARFLAVRFSLKESIAKSVKTGFRGFSMRDMRIIKTELGAPEVLCYGRFKDIIYEKGIVKIEVSISHDGGLVFTNAIALKK